jgi:hypothetical protein
MPEARSSRGKVSSERGGASIPGRPAANPATEARAASRADVGLAAANSFSAAARISAARA